MMDCNFCQLTSGINWKKSELEFTEAAAICRVSGERCMKSCCYVSAVTSCQIIRELQYFQKRAYWWISMFLKVELIPSLVEKNAPTHFKTVIRLLLHKKKHLDGIDIINVSVCNLRGKFPHFWILLRHKSHQTDDLAVNSEVWMCQASAVAVSSLKPITAKSLKMNSD